MKIIVATTFRDFKGTDNDRIQYAFLENLKKQTHADYKLAVTTFGEKNVERVVKEQIGDCAVIRNATVPADSRFSLTEVVLTGMNVARDCGDDCVIVWCTCDVIFMPDFFQTLIEHHIPGYAGIVHPNIIYASLEDYSLDKGHFEPLYEGIDLLFFDSKVLELARGDIEEYRFLDWGVFEWFLGLLAYRYATERINLCGVTTIGKVANNRKLTNESLLYFSRCCDKNKAVLKRYIHDTGIVPTYVAALGLNCHKRFKMLKPFDGYQEMLDQVHRLKLWFFGKLRGLKCKILRLFK